MVRKSAYLLGAIIYMVVALITLTPLFVALLLWYCCWKGDYEDVTLMSWVVTLSSCVIAYFMTRVSVWAMNISIAKFIRLFK